MTIIFQTTFDDINFPTRRAPGVHWDETIDGINDAAVGQIGDGLTGSGAWTTGNGNGDQILTAANNSVGGGGKGFRHWVGNGLNNVGGGIKAFWSARQELWWRFYIRFQAGFAWGGNTDMKCMYTSDSDGIFYWGMKDTWIGGHVQSDGLSRTINSQVVSQGVLWTSVNWNTFQGGSTGDGQWHCIEMHTKMNTGANQDGIFECKLDGVLIGSFSNVRFSNSGGSASWSETRFGENSNNPQSGSSADQIVDFDDIAISDSGWVGLLAPVGSPTPSTVLPCRSYKIWTNK